MNNKNNPFVGIIILFAAFTLDRGFGGLTATVVSVGLLRITLVVVSSFPLNFVMKIERF